MEIKASYHQERLWFIDKFEAGNVYDHSPVYHNIPLVLHIEGGLNERLLAGSLEEMIKRHEILRTAIIARAGQVFQEIQADVDWRLETVVLADDVPGDKHEQALSLSIDFVKQPFELETPPLMRAKLITISDDRHLLAVGFHHIVCDRYSLKIFSGELWSLYRGYLEGKTPALPPLSQHYADFSQWQYGFADEWLVPLVFYWKRRLKGKLRPLELPTDNPRQAIHVFFEGRKKFKIPGAIEDRLDRFGRASGYSCFLVLLAAFKVLLHKYSGQNEIVIGLSEENRSQAAMEQIIGPLANLSVSGSFMVPELSFRQWLEDLRHLMDEDQKYNSLPFEKLVLELKPGIDMSRTALFDILFQYDEAPFPFPLPPTAGMEVDVVETNLGWGKYDLNLLIHRQEDGLWGSLVYNRAYYHDATISRWAGHYTHLLAEVLRCPDTPIADLEVLTEEEKSQLLYEFNDTAAGYPENKTIHLLFEEQAARVPGHIAVRFEDNTLTYSELNRQANQWARLLRSRGVAPDVIVGVMLEPSPGMVVALLAVLKAGGAYLPIDPAYPEKRVIYMLRDAHVSYLLTGSGDMAKISLIALLNLQQQKFEPIKTGARPQITDFDGLPVPERPLVDYEKYNQYIGQAAVKNSIALQGSRGCPYRCAYCHRIWPKKHVCRSAENILAEVKLYYDIGIRRFAFIDDIFNLNAENSSRFFELLLKHRLCLQLFFPSGMRGDLLTPGYIDRMVEAGVSGLALALETPSLRLQKLIGKNLNIDKLRENIEYFCAQHPQVILDLFTMHGFPSETEEEALMTLEFIKSIKWIHFPYINILRIYSNTDMEKIAIDSGIPRQAILDQENLTQNNYAGTLPFDKKFTVKYQTDFLNDYFLLPERLLEVLPHQMRLFTEDEVVQKYNNYLPAEIGCFDDILKLAGLTRQQLSVQDFCDERRAFVPGLNRRLRGIFPARNPRQDALKILLLDVSQEFSGESSVIYDVAEPPLGLMYLMSSLYKQFGDEVEGRIAKSRLDFDNFAQLKELVCRFKPDIVGIRSLNFSRDLFHRTTLMLRQWRSDVPIIAGGPYATSDCVSILQDRHVDILVIGEGESTFGELIHEILENGKKLPPQAVLREIKGIAYIPHHGEGPQPSALHILLLAELTEQVAAAPPGNPGHLNRPGDLAYLIYTSGTTGKPKGSAVEHRSVVRLLFNDNSLFDFGSRDVWTMFHSFCFDFSVWEMYGALLYGGTLIVIPRWLAMDTEKYLELLKSEGVTVLNQTPSAFYNLLNWEMASQAKALRLRYVIFGGEALKPARLKSWQEKYPETRLINMFGITETTVHVTYKEVGAAEIERNTDNIGRPLPTTHAYVLDGRLRLQPLGVAGELAVGGPGLSRGYLNKPELTARKFVDDPYRAGQRLYLSGDLVKFYHSGEMAYLGRQDHQVQLRGFRLEPGEIESQLILIDGVEDAVVIDRPGDNGDMHLCAYVVLAEERQPGMDQADIKNCLAESLPYYMVPSFFIRLNKIPLSANGKVDRQALPAPEIEAKGGHAASVGEVEKKLVEIWADVLKIADSAIGIHSDFFDLGGHSLKATILIARIHREFNIKIPIVEVFKQPTIIGLSAYIRRAAAERHVPIEPMEKREYYPLSASQRRLYFLQQINRQNISYNIPFSRHLGPEVAREKLERAFRQLIRRHDCLRTSFELVEGEPVQRVHDRLDFHITYFESSAPTDGGAPGVERLLKKFVRPFDLGRVPLIRAGLIGSRDFNILVVDMHHIISDGVSHGILNEDFAALYEGRDLPPLKLQYTDYALWANGEEQRKIVEKQAEFWLKNFSGKLPLLDLPTDFPRPAGQNGKGSYTFFSLAEKEAAILRETADKTNATLFMVLLSIFNIWLSRLSGQEDIVVGTPIAGRRHVDLARVIGNFVGTLAIRNVPAGNKSFVEFLDEVKASCLAAFENQEYPFEDLVARLALDRHTGRNPVFDVLFNLLNQNEYAGDVADYDPAAAPDHHPSSAKFDLNLTAIEADGLLIFNLEYATALFKPETIERCIDLFKRIAAAIGEDETVLLKDIDIGYDIRPFKKIDTEVKFNI